MPQNKASALDTIFEFHPPYLQHNGGSGCQKFVPIICHCEEPSDEAIFWKTWEIASLAMTFEKPAKSIGTYF